MGWRNVSAVESKTEALIVYHFSSKRSTKVEQSLGRVERKHTMERKSGNCGQDRAPQQQLRPHWSQGLDALFFINLRNPFISDSLRRVQKNDGCCIFSFDGAGRRRKRRRK